MHRFSTSLLVLALISLLAVPASAATFSDVPESSDYYAAVTYLSAPTRKDANGIVHVDPVIAGVGSGLFAPDRAISVDEFTVMLMNAYYHEDWPCVTGEGADWAKTYTSTACQIGIYTSDEYEDMKANSVTRAQVWEMLADISELAPYPAWLYTGETPSVDFKRDIEYAMYATGLCAEDADPSGTPTRGEVAQLIYRLQTGEYEKQTAGDFWGGAKVTVESPLCWRERNQSMAEWTTLPDKYKTAFIENGWTLQFVEKMRDYYPDDALAIGLTDGKAKTITISRSFNAHKTLVLTHEFGHFAAELADIPLTLGYMYDTERETLTKLVGTGYCKTNRDEMFAEAFRYILVHRDDTEAYAKMQADIPFSLAIIEQAFLDADGVFDLDTMNDVVHTNWEYICAAHEGAA